MSGDGTRGEKPELGWEEAFVAVSVGFGASVDEAVAALDVEARVRADRTVHALRAKERAHRAHVQARALTALAAMLDRAGVT
jgi:hypothetical protein